MESFHKLISPQTYNCSLCNLTYGVFTENKNWKEFRKSSEIAMEFLHRDEFLKQFASKFGAKFNLPVVLIENKGELEMFISDQEINEIKSVKEFIDLINSRKNLI